LLLIAIIIASLVIYLLDIVLIKNFLPALKKAGLAGKDLNKEGKNETKPPVYF